MDCQVMGKIPTAGFILFSAVTWAMDRQVVGKFPTKGYTYFVSSDLSDGSSGRG